MFFISILLFFLFLIKTNSQDPSPYPITLTLPDSNNVLYLAHCLFENKHVILTNNGAFEITQSAEGAYSLISETQYFSNFKIDSQYDNFTIIRDADTHYYIFSYIDQQTMVKRVTNGQIFASEFKVANARKNIKVDEYAYPNKSISISYVDQNGYGQFHLFDPLNDATIVDRNSEDIITLTGKFSCKPFFPSDRSLCLFANGTNRIYYLENDHDRYMPGDIKVFLTETGTIFQSVKIDSIANDNGIGVAFDSNSNVIYWFKFVVSPQVVVLNRKPSITNINLNTMDIMMIYDNLIMITGFDGTSQRCIFYDFDFNEVSFSDKEICGYSNFRATLIDSSTYLALVYMKEGSTTEMEFVQHQILQCKDVTFNYTLRGEYEIRIEDLIIQNGLEYLNEKTGLYFDKRNDSISDDIGQLKEIERNGNENLDIIYYNKNHFYQKFNYTALKPGKEGYNFSIISVITDNFYIPTTNCSFFLNNICYQTCATCDYLGNDDIHNCTQCIDDYYFLEYTTNCLNDAPEGYYLHSTDLIYRRCNAGNCTKCRGDGQCEICNENAYFIENTFFCHIVKPEGYYFDDEAELWRKCPLGCSVCTDPSVCDVCMEGYTFLSSYTNESSDVDCVTECDGNNDRFYFDSNRTFICVKDAKRCPIKFPCYNETYRECYYCETDPPSDLPIEEMFDYIQEDILNLYDKQFKLSNEEYTAIVYDTSKTSNEAYQEGAKLTEINLGNCAEKLGLDLLSGDLIVLQIEKPNSTSVYDIMFAFYTKEGNKINLTQCENTTMFFNQPVKSKESTEQIESIQKLSLLGINAYNTSSPFYYDKCSRFTSPSNGEDVLIRDRIKNYFPTISFCSDNCTPIEFIYNDSYVKCECDVKQKTNYASSKENYVDYANDSKWSYQHVKIITCYDTLFENEYIKENSGFYIMFVLFLLQIVNFSLYMIFNGKIFKNYFDMRTSKTISRQSSQQMIKLEPNTKSIFETENNHKIIINKDGSNLSKSNNLMVHTSNELVLLNKKQKEKIEKVDTVNNVDNKTENNEKDETNKIIDIDECTYEQCISINFSFISILILRLKQFNPIYFIIINKDQYKIIYLYIAAIILELQMIFLFNILFYFDSYISKTFYKGYKFHRQLGSNLLSTICSMAVVFCVKLLIEKLPNEEKEDDEVEEKIKKIKIKNYVLFSIVIALSIFGWYYVAVFTAVFDNTQKYLIFGVLSSIVFYFILICIVGVVTTVIRFLAVKFKLKMVFKVNRFFERF